MGVGMDKGDDVGAGVGMHYGWVVWSRLNGLIRTPTQI